MLKTFSFDYEYFQTISDFSQSEQRLLDSAKQACENSFSPYSKFRVGAAALLENGEIVSASNQESEVFPSGICAERALLYFLQSNYASQIIKSIAIHSTTSDSPCMPCGACRQVLLDTQKRQKTNINVICFGGGKFYKFNSCNNLLPFAFEL